MGGVSKTDECLEKVQRGGRGVIVSPKNYVADFGPLNRAFWAWNHDKKLQHDFPKMRGEGGLRPVGKFPKIHTFWRRHPSLTCARTTVKTVAPRVVHNYSLLVNCCRAPGSSRKRKSTIFLCTLSLVREAVTNHGWPLSESLGVQEL